MSDIHSMQRKFERMFPNLQKGDMYCDDYGYDRLPRSTGRNIETSKCEVLGATVFDFKNETEMFVENVPAIEGLEYISNQMIGDGTANFIQIELKKNLFDKTYFRAGLKPHHLLLEDFLEETHINQINFCNVIGGGIIGEADISRYRGNIINLGVSKGYFVSQSQNLVPEMMQIYQVSSQINKPIEYFETFGKNLRDIKSSNKDVKPRLTELRNIRFDKDTKKGCQEYVEGSLDIFNESYTVKK